MYCFENVMHRIVIIESAYVGNWDSEIHRDVDQGVQIHCRRKVSIPV